MLSILVSAWVRRSRSASMQETAAWCSCLDIIIASSSSLHCAFISSTLCKCLATVWLICRFSSSCKEICFFMTSTTSSCAALVAADSSWCRSWIFIIAACSPRISSCNWYFTSSKVRICSSQHLSWACSWAICWWASSRRPSKCRINRCFSAAASRLTLSTKSIRICRSSSCSMRKYSRWFVKSATSASNPSCTRRASARSSSI
mmetsp:Transcript_18552/g.41104  ORF Transcript_18552/g.41104 Transcript_18552/m.41104 type:complete len:204 (-) Transcript_18552:691-1302(-)